MLGTSWGLLNDMNNIGERNITVNDKRGSLGLHVPVIGNIDANNKYRIRSVAKLSRCNTEDHHWKGLHVIAQVKLQCRQMHQAGLPK